MTIRMSKTNHYVLISTNCQLISNWLSFQSKPALPWAAIWTWWPSEVPFNPNISLGFQKGKYDFYSRLARFKQRLCLSKRSFLLNILTLKTLELKSRNERIYLLKPELIGDLCHRGTLSWNHLQEEEIETPTEFLLRWCDLRVHDLMLIYLVCIYIF